MRRKKQMLTDKILLTLFIIINIYKYLRLFIYNNYLINVTKTQAKNN